MIFHLAEVAEWQAAEQSGEYRVSTRGLALAEVGFIHCSHRHQINEVSRRYYEGAGPLVLLTIDPARAGVEVREEGGFPHLYGPLPVSAVVAATPFHRLRSARVDDAPAVIQLWAAAEAAPSVTDDVASVVRLIEHDPEALIVAEERGEIIGSVMATFDGWRAHFYRLAVCPPARRRGVALALVAEGERRARARGARRLNALVLAAEEPALAFWAAAGYSPDPRIGRHVKTLPLDDESGDGD